MRASDVADVVGELPGVNVMGSEVTCGVKPPAGYLHRRDILMFLLSEKRCEFVPGWASTFSIGRPEVCRIAEPEFVKEVRCDALRIRGNDIPRFNGVELVWVSAVIDEFEIVAPEVKRR